MALFEAHRQQRVIQWFSRVVDTVADEIFITDARTFRYVYANASAQRSLGYGIDELRRMTPMEVTPGLTRETFAGYVDQLRAGARQVVYEGVRRRSDGHVFPVEIRAQLLSAGGQEALVSTAHDISERKAMETLKDQFISVVNHELRTPLTSIHGAVKLLEHGAAGSLPPKAAELVRLAGLNTERLKRIVDDILDLEKIAAGRMTLDMQSLDAGEVLQAVAESQQAAASVAQVALDVQAAAGLRLRADPQRLQQALGNLVSNALKFAPRDTTVVLQAAARGGWVRLSVLDRGPGVPESFRDRIFQRFAQADMDRTRSKGGSGLGLSIVRSLTEQMRGRAGYESVPGRTEFHLDFPMEKD